MKDLRSGFEGELIVPGSSDYETARFSWNHRYDRHPALIARCASENDAVRALEYARRNDLPVAIRSGGHSLAALSTCDLGVVIDFARMDRLFLDEKRNAIVAEPGVRIGQVQRLAAAHGKMVNLPGSSTISATGAVLAAGVGDLTSHYGTSAGALLAAEGILPNGNKVVADESRHADLLWAIRGAGANLLITTRTKLQLVELPLIYHFDIVVPFAAGVDVFHRLAASATQYKERLCPTLAVFGSGGSPGALVASGLFFGTSDDGKSIVNSLTRGIDKAQVSAKMKTYAAATSDSEQARQHFASTRWATSVEPLNDEVISSLLRMEEAPPFERFIAVNPSFGAQTMTPPHQAAYADRKPGIDIGIWADAGDYESGETADRWTRDLWNSIHGERYGGYPSLLEPGNDARIQATYGANYSRLRTLKAKFDPANVLSSNVNISPA
jgi:FAD/FMN-containing dehydrogenase